MFDTHSVQVHISIMEAVQAYLSSPVTTDLSLSLFHQIGLERLLELASDPDRYPLATEAVDRAFLDPHTLIWVYKALGIEGIRRFSANLQTQIRLFRGIWRVPGEELVSAFERIEDLLAVLCSVYSTGDTEIVESVVTTFLSLSRSVPSAFLSREFIALLGTGLALPNAIYQVRYCDLVLKLCVASQALYQAYSELLTQILSIYQTDDLLVKLTLLEVLCRFGDSPHTLTHLLQSSSWSLLVHELDSPYTDEYVKGRLLILFSRAAILTGNFTILNGKFWQMVNNYLGSNDMAQFNAGVTTVGVLCEREEGVNALMNRETSLKSLFSLSTSSNMDKRIGLYSVLTQACLTSSESQAQILYSKLPTFNRSLICKELKSPFPELFEPCFRLLKAISRFNWGVASIFGEAELAEIVLTRSPGHNATVAGLKYGVVEAAHGCELTLTPLLRARIAEYVAAGALAPALGQLEEVVSEHAN